MLAIPKGAKLAGKAESLKAVRGEGVHGLKTAVEHVDCSVVKVCGVKSRPAVFAKAKSEPFVDGAARGIIESEDSGRATIPGREAPVLAIKDEYSRLAIAARERYRKRAHACKLVKDDARR